VILRSKMTAALMMTRAAIYFFLFIYVQGCLPKAKKTDLRSGENSCPGGDLACSAAQAAWALAGVSGPVSRFESPAGFSGPDPLDFTLNAQPGDRFARLSNGKQKAVTELVKEQTVTRPKVTLDSQIEMYFRSIQRISQNSADPASSAGWFLRDAADADRIVVQEFNPVPAGTAILKLPKKSYARGDFILLRGAIPLEVRSEERMACNGLSVIPQVRVEGFSKPLSGGKTTFDPPSARKTVSIQAMARIVDDGNHSFEFGISGDRGACKLKVLEPATFTILVFSELRLLANFSSVAQFLVDASGSSASDFSAPERVITSRSGPSIVTLARKDWRHNKGDFLLVDASVSLMAEDRFAETSGWVQLTRSPSGLNSHLQVNSQTAQEGLQLRNVNDWAFAPSGEGRTTFYLNIMSTGENEKPLAIKDPSIVFLHFGKIGGVSAGGAGLTSTDKAEGLIPATGVTGRYVDLHALRAFMARPDIRPAEDALPCGFFKTGSTRIQGAPAVDIPTPLHHGFKTRWVGESIIFPIVIYENIYHKAPVWTLTPPAGRENHYADRFYEVTVTSPTSSSCKISAVRK
jgi:hypothetical protein